MMCLTLVQWGDTALIAASSRNRTATVQALIGAGADLNLQDSNGSTALIVACMNRSEATVQTLIGAGANLNVRDNDGWTALMMAARWGGKAIVQALLAAGSDRSIRGKVTETSSFSFSVNNSYKFSTLLRP
jgi:ankyrin repeat protein